tara:strand:- start:1636 stop:3042 length:1407 start_codon:yes stop_codon:yes gene_type:complete
MSIDYKNSEYTHHVSDWEMVEHICEGREVSDYLIELNPSDASTENKARNKQYKERAVMYPVAGYTLRGLIGLMFSKYPTIDLPQKLKYMLTNASGGGVSIYQQAQISAAEVIQKGRAGLFVSYPKTEGEVSVAEMDAGGYVATINMIEAEQILNWNVEQVGSKSVLNLVVISEMIDEVQADGYSVESVKQIRELALIGGVFIVREWRQDKDKVWFIRDESTPTDSNGSPWNEIPFVFIGSTSNTPEVNEIPMYGLAQINVAHYRNSADYEDSVWYAGQAQPWMSGVSQTHVDMMKKNNMYVGSRSLLGVPTGEQFGYASAPPNPMVRQAMIDKLDMMIGLGARFIQDNGKEKTATESTSDSKVQHSSLALISSNVSEAYMVALNWAAKFMGESKVGIFQTSMDFVSPTATAQEVQAMVAGFIQGAIPLSDYFRWMKKVDLVDSEKTIEQFSEDIGSVDMPNLDEEAKP